MRTIVFLWENFGPMHIDRCRELALALAGEARVLGLQWTEKSAVYPWTADASSSFRLLTLFPKAKPSDLTIWAKYARMLRACLGSGGRDFFFSHYNDLAVALVAWTLTLMGRRVFGMALSKFDDYDRKIGRELIKAGFLWPYAGFLTNRGRAAEYLHFLTNGRVPLVFGHNTVSAAEVRRLAGAPPAPAGLPHGERYFTAITRLVPKKNLFLLLDAYVLYRAEAATPRPLRICGSGPLEAELRARIASLDLADHVSLTGFIQRPEIARELAGALALILPSTEEQFGNVIIEAQAMGVPCLVSDNCGARETLIRSAVNGFLFEPDNPQGLARFMGWLDTDPALWQRLATGCATTLPRCDTPAFVEGVRELVSVRDRLI